MHEVNLRKIDLNLLVVLETLLEHRQVTRAAEHLNMSQPAVSRALQRLRLTFNDPLLVKSVQGYDLTARAADLQPRLKSVLTDLDRLITRPEFDPASSEDQIRFACLDLEGSLFLPKLMRTLRQKAPGMRLRVDSEPGNHFRYLQQGDVDFVISGLTPQQGQSEIRRLPLGNTSIVCLMDQENPLSQTELTLERYLNAPHGVVSMTGLGVGVIDKLLDAQGLKRSVRLRLTSFLSIPEYLVGTDLLFALPEILAQRLCRHAPLTIKALPAEIPNKQIRFNLYWHQRNHQDPKNLWVRSMLSQARTL